MSEKMLKDLPRRLWRRRRKPPHPKVNLVNDKVRRLLADLPFGEVRDNDLTMVHRVRQVELRSDLAQDEPHIRRRRELPCLIENRRDGLRGSAGRSWKTPLPRNAALSGPVSGKGERVRLVD
jgi:hypothetical protein